MSKNKQFSEGHNNSKYPDKPHGEYGYTDWMKNGQISKQNFPKNPKGENYPPKNDGPKKPPKDNPPAGGVLPKKPKPKGPTPVGATVSRNKKQATGPYATS